MYIVIIVRYTFDGVVRSYALPIDTPELWLKLAVKPGCFKISVQAIVSAVVVCSNDLPESIRYHAMW